VRICLVSQEYPPETARGGLGTQTQAKARGLSGLGHEVVVVSAAKGGVRTEQQSGGITVIRIPGFHPRMAIHTEAAAWLTYSAEVAAEVWRLHRQRPLDLVDFAEWGGEGYLHVLNQTAWNHIPTTVQIHGPLVMFAETMGWPERDSEIYRVGRMMEETSLRLADAVYSSSRHSAKWCATHYGLDEDRIEVLHTGVDTEMFQPGLAPKEERPTVLFVGRLERQKGVDVLFEAACAVSAEVPGLRLRFAGGDSSGLAPELESQARERGMGDLVEFKGYIPHSELPSEFNRAHVMAAPSVAEGGPGFVYLEAMACGLPVVGCREGGASETIADGETGVLVEQRSVAGLAAALRRLLRNPAQAAAMGAKAREHVRMNFDSGKCLAALEAFYLEVAGAVRPGAR